MERLHCLSTGDRYTTGERARVARAYLDLRRRYVVDHGWLDLGESDDDVYDENKSTFYFVRSASTTASASLAPRIQAGLRITRVSSFRESLTWSMLVARPDVRARIETTHASVIADADRHAAAARNGLWDVTRMVSPADGSVSAPVIVQSLYELFGMAIYKSVVEPDADPTWLCLTTVTIKRLFDMSGFPTTVLFRGEVTPGDGYDCVLCLIQPRSALQTIRVSDRLAHRRAYRSITAGLDALRDEALMPTGT